MRGLDTNVLVRVLLRDDRKQATAAEAALNAALAAGESMLVSLLTVLETEWVLRSRGGLAKSEVLVAFKSLLEARDLLFEHEEVIEQALYFYENSNADFADCLMLARYLHAGCTSMLTFDSQAAKLAGSELIAS